MLHNFTSNFEIIFSILVYCASLGCPWAYMWLIPPGLLEIASMVSKQCWIYRLGIFTLHIGVKWYLNYSLGHFRSYPIPSCTWLQFRFSEKATKFGVIFLIVFSDYLVTSWGRLHQIFVAFLEYMNFKVEKMNLWN